jgi:hypothetical protein
MGRETNKQRRQTQAASAREKAAASRAQQQREDQRRRAIAILASVVVIAVVAGVIAFIAINHKSKSGPATAASASVISQLTSVPAPVTDATGAGTAIAAPESIQGGTALDAHGKPTLLYIGAEFCPFCAAQRWALVEALSRFGTFHGLKQITSSEDKISTFTFTDATYTSKYLNFDAKEQAGQNREPLQKLTSVENTQWNKYLLPGQSGPGYPFLDFNGSYVSPAPMIDPKVVIGKTWSQIAGSLKTESSPVAQAINGAANLTTAAICKLTNNQPATACTAAVTAVAQKFPAYQG